MEVADAANNQEDDDKFDFFSEAELKTLSKRRREFEFRLQRTVASHNDYIKYITFELNLLRNVRANLKKKVITAMQKVEKSIIERADNLFKIAIQRYPYAVRIWTIYIMFLKHVGFIETATAILIRMVTVHKDKPQLWQIAANWEFKENNNMENARRYLQHGLQLHAKSTLLYEEAFRQELKYADARRKAKAEQAEADDSDVEEGETPEAEEAAPSTSSAINMPQDDRPAEVFFESSIHKVDNIQFYIDLLSIAKKYDFTERLQNRIVNHLLFKYRNDELAWDTLARGELEGFSYLALALEQALLPGCQPSLVLPDENDNSYKELIHLCVTAYCTGVKHLNTERMWSFYLETLLELNQDIAILPIFKQNLLLAAFEQAQLAGQLQEKYYLKWADILQTKRMFNKLMLVLGHATERFPSNADLWLLKLRLHYARDEKTLGGEVFHQAHNSLGADNVATVPFYKVLIQYYEKNDKNVALIVFENAIKMPSPVSRILKPQFLEWLLVMKGIGAVRKEYEYEIEQGPPCLELHAKMIQLELMQPQKDISLIRNCYEVACREFGIENADIWLEYARFEMDNGEEIHINTIFERAKKTIDPLQVDMIVREFDLIRGNLQVKMETQ